MFVSDILPVLLIILPQIATLEETLFIPLGSSVMLNCDIDSCYQNYWQRENEVLYINRIPTYHKFAGSVFLLKNYSLLINPFHTIHEGTFSCFNGNVTISTFFVAIRGLYIKSFLE